MFVSALASGWGSSARNSHAIELPNNIPKHYYCMITFEARHYHDTLSWKLRDKSGFDHDLPYFFKQGDIDRRLNVSKFSIIVYGSQSQSDYRYECSLKCWPKDLQRPIAKYYSITTIEISPSETCNEQPLTRTRRKGEQEWKIAGGALVTFDSLNTVHECQVYYQLIDGTIIESPILEVTCMSDKFDIDKDCFIDYEDIIVNKHFSISFNEKSLYNTNYTATIRPYELPADNVNEIVVKSNQGLEVQELVLIPGERYRLKLSIEKLNISYSKIIQVPHVASIDSILWTDLFGTEDRVTFHRHNSTLGTHWTDLRAGASVWAQTGVETTYLTLYKNGVFYYKYHSQPFSPDQPEQLSSFAGSFALSRLNSEIIRYLCKNKTQPKPTAILSPIDSKSLSPFMPELLQLPEIIKTIVNNAYNDVQSIAKQAYNEQLKRYRLVSKTWSQAIQPTIAGTITSESVRIFGVDLERQ